MAYRCEDWRGIASDENHVVVRWSEAPVFFSFAQKGGAISAHFSSERGALRVLRKAIECFCRWAFLSMPWCEMIMACVTRASVKRLLPSCGFEYLKSLKGLDVYVRCRNG